MADPTTQTRVGESLERARHVGRAREAHRAPDTPWTQGYVDGHRALASARAAPGVCVVRNDRLAANWDNGRPPPQTPLVAYSEQGFTPIAQLGGHVVSVRKQ